VGKIGKTHGIHGEIWMDLYFDFPEGLVPGKILYLGEAYKPKTIRSFHFSRSRGLVAFNGINNPEDAGLLVNQPVYLKAAQMPKLPEGKYYHHEMIGLKVLDESKMLIGTLSDILQTGSNDVYVVTDENDPSKETLLPAIKSVIINIDIENRTMIVKLQEWI
jgi:16S rRNA processing protein RimM